MNKTLIAGLLVGWVSTCAYAGPLNAPQLKYRQYVYSIPPDFEPPQVFRHGMEELQQEALKAHYPFYVVFVKDLPAGVGDITQRMEEAVDGLAADWEKNFPAFRLDRSQIFLLSYNPRKYQFLAGKDFSTRLGFRRDAHKPYTALFEQSVAGTPKDPTGGIAKVIRAVDEYLFENTDPAKVAARKAVEQKAEEQRKLAAAVGALDTEILRLSNLLAVQKYLPDNTSTYESSLKLAREVRTRNQGPEMALYVSKLRASTDALDKYVTGKQTAEAVEMARLKKKEDDQNRAESAARTSKILGFLGVSVGVGIVVLLFLGRARKVSAANEKLRVALKAWDDKLANAATRYYGHYGERDNIKALTQTGGRTEELYRSVTGEIDDIAVLLAAMKEHVSRCRNVGSTASPLSSGPSQEALQMLQTPFKFDTGQVESAELFSPETKSIQVDPKTFEAQMEERFAQTQAGWQKLKDALAIQLRPMEEHFPQKRLDALIEFADEHGIERRWLSDHPLYGDALSDKQLYSQVNAQRTEDPVAFLESAEDLKSREREVEDKIRRLFEAKELARKDRVKVTPTLGDTIVDPDDDPVVTFNAARRAEDEFAGLLSSADTVEEVEAKAAQVHELSQKTAYQQAALQSAIQGAEEALIRARKGAGAAEREHRTAEIRVTQAQTMHTTVDAGQQIANGQKYIEEGSRNLQKAERQIGEKRHLTGRKTAELAAANYSQAISEFQGAVRRCELLDQNKAQFERELQAMADQRRDLLSELRLYNSNAALTSFELPILNQGPYDYIYLLSLLRSHQNQWVDEVRRARYQYEQVLRLEEERRSSDNDWSSSSSDSSWSSSSSSSSDSSGGSWDSGSSSSSSSDSSGGSW